MSAWKQRKDKMAILRTSKKEQTRLVGIHVSPQVHNYLTLHALAGGESKASLLKHVIEEWIGYCKKNEKDLIDSIIAQIKLEWKIRRRVKPRSSFQEFKSQLEKELLWKGLTQEQVETILKSIVDNAKTKK
jgi:hypothetical protein